MVLEKRNIAARVDDWVIPLWMKAAITFFALSAWVILIHSLLSTQKSLFGLSDGVIVGISLGLVLLSSLSMIAGWIFPRSPLVLSLYWLIRFLREQICVFALLGLVYLLSIRASPFSLRGGIAIINLILLFLLGWRAPPLGTDRFPLPWMQSLSIHLEKLGSKINSTPTWLISSIVVVLPILIVCAVIYVGLHASLRNYGPYSVWNDETGYWLWVRSFSHVGLNAGYNAPNELIAPAAFNHYGEGSPLYVYFYGSIGRWIGWFAQLPIFINFVLLTLAILLFIYATKLDQLQIVFTGLIVILTWPVLLFLPITSQETLNQAIGFVLAIVFFKLLTQREELRLPTRIFFVFLVYLAALVRLSWGLLLIPVVFYALDGKILRRVVLAILFGLGLYVSATLITNYLVPPTNNSIFMTMKDSLIHGPRVFTEQIINQLFQMFQSRTLDATIAVMFQIAIIISWRLILLARLIKSRLPIASILQSGTVFDIYNMATLALAGLMFYIQAAFSRTFAPSILVVYLLQAARKNYRFLATLLLINIVFFYYIGDSEVLKGDFTSEFPERAQLQAKFEKWIVFDPATKNPWCNTLLIPLESYDRRLTVIPPGIGISYIYDSSFKVPIKSKYLLFDRETYESLSDNLHVKLLASSSMGKIYYNLDSGCGITQ